MGYAGYLYPYLSHISLTIFFNLTLFCLAIFFHSFFFTFFCLTISLYFVLQNHSFTFFLLKTCPCRSSPNRGLLSLTYSCLVPTQVSGELCIWGSTETIDDITYNYRHVIKTNSLCDADLLAWLIAKGSQSKNSNHGFYWTWSFRALYRIAIYRLFRYFSYIMHIVSFILVK